MPDLLGEIFRQRHRLLEREMEQEPLAHLQTRAEQSRLCRRSLRARLAAAAPPALICEIKRASPSAGVIDATIDPGAWARGYQRAGADAVSVLTEPDHFLGRLQDLDQARAGCDLPLLRKDFLDHPYQVVQSAAHGADAILAIVAGLDDRSLAGLLAEARAWGLEALVEVHSQPELERALDQEVDLLGINNRDLRTLQVDLGVTERLLPLVPKTVTVVSESGFRQREQLRRCQRAGVGAFLVGEALLRSGEPLSLLGQLKGSDARVMP
ncbi:MAG: indole-3-glycerol phosphate synthase TrpC [Candidatus Dormibacteria bacterium]